MATAGDALTRVRDVLADTDSESWSDTELLRWASDGVRVISDLKPAALATPIDIALDAGAQQLFPATMIHLVGLIGLVSDDGLTHYKAVTKVPLEQVDREAPNWRNDTPTADAQHVMVDENDHQTFWIYPPSDGTRSLRVLAVTLPADLTALGDTLPFRNAQYLTVLVDYIAYRALLRDADETAERQRAFDHYQQFAAALVGQDQARMLVRDQSEAVA